MMAIIAGFIGVLMIVKPSIAHFEAYELLALVIVFCVRDARPSHQAAFRRAFPTFLVALRQCRLRGRWAEPRWRCAQGLQWPAVWQVGLLALAACFLSSGYLFMVATLRLGELSGTAPFRYSIMVFAIASGILVFGEFPDWIAMLGMALIVATGLYAARREALNAQARTVSDSARTPAP